MNSREAHEIISEAAASLKLRRPSMSVRAVAGKLGVSASYWSKILRGQRRPPGKLLPKIIEVLEIDLQRVALIQNFYVKSIEESKYTPATGIKRSSPQINYGEGFKEFGRNEYWLLEDWYYLPILNILTLAKPPKTDEEIAGRLGLRVDQTHAALRRLLLFGFLVQEDGEYKGSELQIRFPTSRSHNSVRKFHQAMIQKAQNVLKDENYAEGFAGRLITGVTFAGTSSVTAEAKLILEEALFRAADLMAEAEENDELFQINIQFFPLSVKKK